MGWYGQAGRGTHAEIDAETKPEGRCYLTSAGTHHWHIARAEDGGTVVALELIERKSEHGIITEWSYKPMDEAMGPNAVDCPLALLAATVERDGYAAEWRARVRAYHAQRAVSNGIKPGDVITLGGNVEARLRGARLTVRLLRGRNIIADGYRVPRSMIVAVERTKWEAAE